jgi:alanyl-tRNA synthetase
LTDLAKVPVAALEEKLNQTFEELRTVQKKLALIEQQALQGRIPAWVAAAKNIGGHRVALAELGVLDGAEALRTIGSGLRAELGSDSVAIVTALVSDKPAVLVAVGSEAIARGVKAGELVKLASGILGGGGGGKDDMAQGGGTDATKLSVAIEAIEKALA